MTTAAADSPHGQRLSQGSSVLVVCAHPDDESFGLGAVLDRFASGGVSVSVLCLTRGEASTLSATEDDDLGERRRSELRAAGAALGLGRVELRDYPDGALATVPLGQLAAEVTTMAGAVGADLLLVFDEGGVTGHPDHCRATEAALAGAPGLPVLAWTLPRRVADALNAELGTTFVGRAEGEIDTVLPVDRAGQHRAIACHHSQSADNPPLWRRLQLLGEEEWLRWLRRPPKAAAYDRTVMPLPDQHPPAAEEWDRRYASTSRLFRAEADETLVEMVTPLAPRRAVDVGAGEGRNSLWLASRGWEVTAVDISKEALGRLEDAATPEGLPVVTLVDDITTYLAGVEGRGDAFDLVVLAYLHPEPAQRAELLHATAGVVAPGGYLFVVGHHRLSRGVAGPFDPTRLYTEDDLRHAAHGLQVLRLGQRHGKSDIAEPGTDVILWARRP
jgi:LmbE family N-acetylglucosaminyl deacetylase/predicted TPR repeat methyltransferase